MISPCYLDEKGWCELRKGSFLASSQYHGVIVAAVDILWGSFLGGDIVSDWIVMPAF